VGIPGICIFKKWDLIENTTGSGSELPVIYLYFMSNIAEKGKIIFE
jgi:hypothetical protein